MKTKFHIQDMVLENERTHRSMFRIYLIILTSLLYFSTLQLLSAFYDSSVHYSIEYLVLFLLLIPVWYFGLSRATVVLLHVTRVNHYSQVLRHSVIFSAIGAGALFAIISILELNIPREFIIVFTALDWIGLLLSYIVVNQYHMNQRRRGKNLTNIIFIADEGCDKFIQNIADNRELGYNISLIISDSQAIHDKFKSRYKVLKRIVDLPCLIKSQIVDEVFYCKKQYDQEDIQKIMFACEEIGVSFRYHSSLLEMSAMPVELNHFNGVPFLTYKNTPNNQFALSWKYVFDFVFSLVVVVLWMPILLLVGMTIKLSSRGPVIFTQKRVGLHGREFNIYKFRTMVQDAEKLQAQLMEQNEANGPVFKIKDDPRITAIGKFLRKTNLDEFPQFFNVLKGDMSLVGPRPPIMKEVMQYKPWQLRRLSMRPGITCSWQIMPQRNKISFEEWMKLDLQYIDNWSLETDLMLTFKTIRSVLLGSGQ
jgi:exopolysaccharide biosynthesis polyprenyl glycosylphosphotransferase